MNLALVHLGTMRPLKNAPKQQRIHAWRTFIFAKLRLNRFIGTQEQKAHSSESVLGILLIGTLVVFSLLLLPLLFSLLFANNTYVLGRVLFCVGLITLLLLLVLVWKRWDYYRLTATALVWFYGVVACFGLASWGINTPFAILLIAVVIVLSGILLGARSTLLTAAAFSVVLVVFQVSIDFDFIAPKPQLLYPSRYGDVIGYSILFFILALISWLYSRQMERSLRQALNAEEALTKEKKLLAIKLEERTRKLQEAQLAEMQQLYRFAELGQLSTALLHDLSNHLTVLTLEIEEMQRRQHSQAIKRAKQTIFYLDRMVDQVRSQLRDSSQVANFKVQPEIAKVVKQLKTKASSATVTIETKYATNKQYKILGDPVRFRQILTILISNSIDAYKGADRQYDKRMS